MSNVTIELNLEGLRELRRSREVQDMLQAAAGRIQAQCGEGYESFVSASGRQRARAGVRTTTYQAAADNARNNTLLMALGSFGSGQYNSGRKK